MTGWRLDLGAEMRACTLLGVPEDAAELAILRAPGAFLAEAVCGPGASWPLWPAEALPRAKVALLVGVGALPPGGEGLISSAAQGLPAGCCLVVALCRAGGATVGAQRASLESGADQVLEVPEGATLGLPELQGAIVRAEVLTRRHEEAVAQNRATLEERWRRALASERQSALWRFAQAVFTEIPPLDAQLEERPRGAGSYDFELFLGGGSSGRVHLARSAARGKVAIKVCKKSSTYASARALASLERELIIFHQLPPHPGVLRGLEVLHGRSAIYLVMPYCGNVHLAAYHFQRGYPLPSAETLALAQQALGAVRHLHSNFVAHRDIKCENFVVETTKDGLPLTLVDFGLSAVLAGPEHRLYESGGTHPYAPPEVLAPRPGYLPLPADVWGLGALFLELVHGPGSLEKALGWSAGPPSTTDAVIADLPQLAAFAAGAPQGSPPHPVCASRELLARAARHMVQLTPSGRWSLPALGRLLGLAPVPAPEEGAGFFQGRALNEVNRFAWLGGARSRAAAERASRYPERGAALTSALAAWEESPLMRPFLGALGSSGCIVAGVEAALAAEHSPRAAQLRQKFRRVHWMYDITDEVFDRFVADVGASVTPSITSRLRCHRGDVMEGFLRRKATALASGPGHVIDGGHAAVWEQLCAGKAGAAAALPLSLDSFCQGTAPSPLELPELLSEVEASAVQSAFRDALVGAAAVPIHRIDALCIHLGEATAEARARHRLRPPSPRAGHHPSKVLPLERIAAELEATLRADATTTRLCAAGVAGLRRCLAAQLGMCGSAYLPSSPGTKLGELGRHHAPLAVTDAHFDAMLAVLLKHGATERHLELLTVLRPWALGPARLARLAALDRLEADTGRCGLPAPRLFAPPGPAEVAAAAPHLRPAPALPPEPPAEQAGAGRAALEGVLRLLEELHASGSSPGLAARIRNTFADLELTGPSYTALVHAAFHPLERAAGMAAPAATFASIYEVFGGYALEPSRPTAPLAAPGRELRLSELPAILQATSRLCLSGPLARLRERGATAHGPIPCTGRGMEALLRRLLGAERAQEVTEPLSPAALKAFRATHRDVCGFTQESFEGFLRCAEIACTQQGVRPGTLRPALLQVRELLFATEDPADPVEALQALRLELAGFLVDVGGAAGLTELFRQTDLRARSFPPIVAYLAAGKRLPPCYPQFPDHGHTPFISFWLQLLQPDGGSTSTQALSEALRTAPGVTQEVFGAYLEALGQALAAAGIGEYTSTLFLRLAGLFREVVIGGGAGDSRGRSPAARRVSGGGALQPPPGHPPVGDGRGRCPALARRVSAPAPVNPKASPRLE